MAGGDHLRAFMARPVMWVSAATVVALEIPYPLVHGHARNVLTVVTVGAFAAASVLHAVVAGSVRAALSLLTVFGVGGFAAEVVGVHTGAPFGRYRYLGGLGHELAGVPVAVGLAWVMMAWPATCVAVRVSARRSSQVVIAAIALAGWDVFLDPQMVDAHHWRWLGTTAHLPGIDDVPLSNFGGWLLVALVLMTMLRVMAGNLRINDDGPMVALWIWTWLSSVLANIAFFHRPAVAAWGLVAMGVVGLPLLASMRPQGAPS